MQFGRKDALAYAPESNDDDIRDNRDDPKKRDNRPGIKNPYIPSIFLIFRFLPIYAQVIHNAGSSMWERSDPIIPETGLPMISGGQGLGFEEAEVMSAVDRKELSRSLMRR